MMSRICSGYDYSHCLLPSAFSRSPRDFYRCVERYCGDAFIKLFSCYDQLLAMSFPQLTARESLRDLESALSARRGKGAGEVLRGRS
jgi:hypothetical protein